MHTGFAYKLEPFRDDMSLQTNSNNREPILEHNSQQKGLKAHKLHLCMPLVYGSRLMGWKCTDDNLRNTWATAKLRLQMNRVLCSVLLLATYMNSLFRTGVPPPSHLTRTGFLKRVFCEHRQTFLSQWTHSAQMWHRVVVMQWRVVAELLEKRVEYISWTEPSIMYCMKSTTNNQDSTKFCTDNLYTDVFHSLTLVWLGQMEHLRGDHRYSCCRPRCRTQRHCNNSPHPHCQIYRPPLNWSYQQTLGQSSA